MVKNKPFIGINMNDFHENQKQGEAGTIVNMKFVSAANAIDAMKLLRDEYPGIAWSVIPKTVIDNGYLF